MNALILVDIQNDFVSGGALVVPEGDQIVPIVNRLMPHFDRVVAIQDWHPADHLSFASQHAGKQVGDVIELGGLQQILWPDHCVQNTRGAQFVSALDVECIDAVFQKGTDREIDSYSGFFDNGHRKATGLADYLTAQGIKEIYICGLATDYCVKFTAQDARKLGFETYVFEDACRGVNLTQHDVDKALASMREARVGLVRSDDVIGDAGSD